MNDHKYSLSLRFMHWLIAIMIFIMLAAGFYMTSLPPSDPNKYNIYGIHKAIGVIILFLVILRIVARYNSYIPPYPDNISQCIITLARCVQYGLYLLTILMPLSGYIMSSSSGKGIKIFIVDVPLLIKPNKFIAQMADNMHSIFAYMLIAFITLHILGAIRHLIIDKQNIFKRII